MRIITVTFQLGKWRLGREAQLPDEAETLQKQGPEPRAVWVTVGPPSPGART